MERIPVTSSNVAEVGYDVSTMTLEVAFHSGGVYQYFDVPEMIYQEMMSADSVGKYLNVNVKNSYRYAQV